MCDCGNEMVALFVFLWDWRLEEAGGRRAGGVEVWAWGKRGEAKLEGGEEGDVGKRAKRPKRGGSGGGKSSVLRLVLRLSCLMVWGVRD